MTNAEGPLTGRVIAVQCDRGNGGSDTLEVVATLAPVLNRVPVFETAGTVSRRGRGVGEMTSTSLDWRIILCKTNKKTNNHHSYFSIVKANEDYSIVHNFNRTFRFCWSGINAVDGRNCTPMT